MPWKLRSRLHAKSSYIRLRQILSLYEDGPAQVEDPAIRAMEALSKTLTKDQMEHLSVPLRRIVENTGSQDSPVSGFSHPGGLKPILPIFIQALLAGTNEQREQSAYGLGEIVERTTADGIKAYVTQITGQVYCLFAKLKSAHPSSPQATHSNHCRKISCAGQSGHSCNSYDTPVSRSTIRSTFLSATTAHICQEPQ